MNTTLTLIDYALDEAHKDALNTEGFNESKKCNYIVEQLLIVSDYMHEQDALIVKEAG